LGSISPEQAFQLAQKKFPRTFGGFKDVNWGAVRGYQQQCMRLENTDKENVRSTYCPSLIPLVGDFANFINGFSNAGNLRVRNASLDLMDEINYHMTPRRSTGHVDVTPYWFFDMQKRFLAVFGEPTNTEKAVFLHALYPGVFLGVFKDDAYETPYKTMLSIENFDNKGREERVSITQQHTNYSLHNLIKKEISRHLPPEITPYPMFGKGKLGIPFLVVAFSEHVHPHAYTTKAFSYHGIPKKEATPSGVEGHDTVHAFIMGKTLKRFRKHVTLTVDDLFGKLTRYEYNSDFPEQSKFIQPISAENLAKKYIPYAAGKYKALHSALRDFHNNFLLTEVLPKRGLRAYKEIMGGFFWFTREVPTFPHSIYKKHSLESMMESMIRGATRRLRSKSSWESSFDPLETSVFDGSPFDSGIPDEFESKEDFLLPDEFESKEDFLLAESIKDGMSKETYHQIDLEKTNVSFHPKGQQVRFIDIDLHFQNGYSKKESYTTLFHKWANLDDPISLLRWSGLRMKKPNLKGLDNHRDIAMAFIDQVQDNLVKRMELFQSAFRFFVRSENQKGGLSYDQLFFKRSFRGEQNFKKWINSEVKKSEVHLQSETLDFRN
ncbi:MAG: hypothetical protein GY915_04345, partial [bacterium]|nr:hypothetical protein [bacterium]